MQLFSDNSLKYTLTVTNLSGNDQLVNAYLQTGDVITSGPVVLSFKSGFNGSTATGTISGVRQSLVDSLKSDANEIYINVQSAQVGSGLVRGQLNATVDWAMDVWMTFDNVVPLPVNVECSGLGLFRLTSNKKLYAIIYQSVDEFAPGVISANIHQGEEGENGEVLLSIYSDWREFGQTIIIPVDDDMISKLKNDHLYVNAPSIEHPDGAIRGQIR